MAKLTFQIRNTKRHSPFPNSIGHTVRVLKQLYSLSPEDQASNDSLVGFLLYPPSSFDSPVKLSSRSDISRYEWGAAGTIFPSSCYPVSFFAAGPPMRFIFQERGTPGPPLSRWRDSAAPPASDRSVRVVAFPLSTKATREKREGMVEGSTCSLPGHIFKHGIGRIGSGNGSLNLREAIRGCSYVSTSLLQFKSHPRIILCSRLLYRVEPCIKSFVERGH